MLKHITAALAAFFLLLPGSVFAESLDLSKLGDIEEAEQWEERAWYQREDGSDWRVQDDGSVIVTISATGDVTTVSYTHLDVYKRQGQTDATLPMPGRNGRIRRSRRCGASSSGIFR